MLHFEDVSAMEHKKKWGGGVVTVALKNENLRGISEQHRFTFELYDKNSFEVNFQK